MEKPVEKVVRVVCVLKQKKHVFAMLSIGAFAIHFIAPETEAGALAIVGIIVSEFA